MNTQVLESLVAGVRDAVNTAARIRALTALHQQVTADVVEVLTIAAEGVEEDVE